MSKSILHNQFMSSQNQAKSNTRLEVTISSFK